MADETPKPGAPKRPPQGFDGFEMSFVRERGPSAPPQTQQPQWGQQHPAPGSPASPGSATAALILGILALLVCPLICAPLALIYGSKARNEIDASGGRLGGRGMATAGIVLGWIGLAWALLWVAFMVVVLI